MHKTLFACLVLGFITLSADNARAVNLIVAGTIITVDKTQPTAEAVAVAGDRIVSVGSRENVFKLATESTRIVELGEHALLPGFIDAHGHMTMVGTWGELINLSSPPVGTVETMADLVKLIRARIADHEIPPGEWVFGYGYDDSLIHENRHPDRDDLDKASTEHPIALIHVSGHLMATNTMGLTLAKITAESENPPGGVIRRRPGTTTPNGVLEETASYPLRKPMTKFMTPELTKKAMQRSARLHASYGITTIQDGGTDPRTVNLFRETASESPFPVDVVAFVSGARASDKELETVSAETYENGFRVGGVKLMLDGSPQGRTAYLSAPYTEGPPGAKASYRAYPVMPQDEYNRRISLLINNGTPVLTHANGDGAIDMMIAGVGQALEGRIVPDHRTVIIHAQLMREDQLHLVKKLGMVPSYYAAHPFFWGDWHRKSFGEERASFISPVARTDELGVPYTIHNDSPVVPPDMMRLLWIATNRETRSGYVLGPEQRATTMQAIHAVTLGAAYQYFEEEEKGSITVGKRADLVILGANPLAVDKSDLKDIPIIETIARGKTVYRRASVEAMVSD